MICRSRMSGVSNASGSCAASGHAQRRCAGRQHVRRRQQDVALLVQRHQVHVVGVFGRGVHDRGVELELAQPSVQLGGGQPGIDLHLHQRVSRTERREHQRRRRRSRWNGAQPKRAGDPGPHSVHLGLERVVLGQNPLGPHDQALALGGEALKAVSAVDQGDVQLAFELGDRGRQRRLRHVALLGGPGEVSLLGDRDEVLQLTKEHPHLRAGGRGTQVSQRALTASKHPLSSSLR